MDQHSKRKLENQLMVMGLKGVTDPELIQQLADLVSHWPGDRNEFFVELLRECDGPKRYEMYQAMAPKLTFKPISYIACETSIAARASAMVSQGRMRVEGRAPDAITVGGIGMSPRKPRAILKCHVCSITEQFTGETPVEAIIKARKAGWRHDDEREYCPDCLLKDVPYALDTQRRNEARQQG